MRDIEEYMASCRLCPRNCGIDRRVRAGACGAGADIVAARAALHFWEEPCISGARGSGAVFFSGCSLGCIFCQNAEISRHAGDAQGACPPAADSSVQMSSAAKNAPGAFFAAADRSAKVSFAAKNAPGAFPPPADRFSEMSFAAKNAPIVFLPGKAVSVEELAAAMIRLQNEQGANNINLVTAAHFAPQVAAALELAKDGGLIIPVVYNSSGYENVDTLRLFEGLVDVWLPDFKYLSSDLAGKLSHAPDYPEVAKAALAEMVRQAGEAEFYVEEPFSPANAEESRPAKKEESSSAGGGALDIQAESETINGENSGQAAVYPPGGQLIRRGVIVRNLLLPGHVKESEAVIRYLYETYGDSIYISMMNQYTPMVRLPEEAAWSGKAGAGVVEDGENTPVSGRIYSNVAAERAEKRREDLSFDHDLSPLTRRVTKREYDRLVDYALDLGVKNAFIQAGGTAKASFVPAWDGSGL